MPIIYERQVAFLVFNFTTQFTVIICTIQCSTVIKSVKLYFRYSSRRNVISAIQKIRYPRGGTKLGYALRYTSRYLLGRDGRKKVVIVMTDGRSQDSPARAAAVMRRKGVMLVAVGIGRKYDLRQLRSIASRKDYVFTSSFKTLGNVVGAIKQQVCRGKTFGLWN